MIKFRNILKHIKIQSILPNNTINYTFSERAKSTQLIIHSPGDIQKLHLKRKDITNQKWQKIRENDEFSPYRISLIGLPNSGKSTLFNCLIGQSLAIVDKLAGMTRDRRQFNILEGLATVIDTPGVQIDVVNKKGDQSIKDDIFKQTITALHESDLILLVVDAKKPITDELSLMKYIRTFERNMNVVLIVNKCDGVGYDEGQIINQTSKLGIQEMFMCSGQEGTGIFQILHYISDQIPQKLKKDLEVRKRERNQKFEELIKKIKSQMKQLQMKGVQIKEWERDFRIINPQPQLNEDLDFQNYQDFVVRPQEGFASKRGKQTKNLKLKNTIKICFIGRPNVGKSSLINEVLGQERLVVSDVPHTTRDSIGTKLLFKNRKIEIIDTAGLNTPNFEKNEDEYLRKVQTSTMLHVKESHVVIYVMDAFSAFKIDDFKLIRNVINEGRPVIIAVNKWEIIKEQYKYKAINYLKKQIDKNLGQIHGHPIIFVSAKMGTNLNELMDNIITTYDKWNGRISTGLLNDWLSNFKKLDNLPKDKEATLKINYIIQARVRPPHYIFFVNNKSIFKNNYLRFVSENMAKQFQMQGIPLRITLKSTNNKENRHKEKHDRKKRRESPLKQKMQDLKKKYDNFGL